MKKWTLVISGALVSMAALLGLISIPAFPAHAEDEAPNPAMSIQISPVSKRVDLNASQDTDLNIKVTNIGTENLDFRVYASPYSVQDMTYEANFDNETDFTALSKWISFDQAEYKAIKAGEIIEVAYHIKTPADIPGGGQYAVIFAETLPVGNSVESGTGIQTVGRVGSLLYANLGGETREQGELVSFDQPALAEKSLKPISVVKNTGNIDFAFNLDTTVKTLFGKEVFKNNLSRFVLPGTTREVSQEWLDAPTAGLYMVTNKISFLNQTHVDETKLVYIGPVWVLITICAILGLILFLIVLIIVRKVRKYKKNKASKKAKSKVVSPEKSEKSEEKTDETKSEASDKK